MNNLCICAAKETVKNRLQSSELQVGHVRLVTIFSENDHDSEDFCLNVCNSDYIPPPQPSENENQFIHFTYLPFLRLIKCIKHLHEMLLMTKLTKLKMTADFDDEDMKRNISITIDSSGSLFVVHCNGQKLLIDEFAIVFLMNEVTNLPKFVNVCRESYSLQRLRSARTDRMVENWRNINNNNNN